jgi:hypothetical protein
MTTQTTQKAATRGRKGSANSSIAPAAIDEARDDAPDDAPDDPAHAAEESDIEAVSRELGPSSEAEVIEVLGEVNDVELQHEGARVATPRVSKEAARIVRTAQAFYRTASPAVVAALCMSPAVLRILAWSAAEGHRAWQGLQSKRAARRGAKASHGASFDAALDAARGERDQLGDALQKVAASDTTERVKLTSAMQPAAQGETETGPGKALDTLVAIGRAYLKSGSAAVKARCALWGVTRARLDAAAVIAREARTFERADKVGLEALAHDQGVVDRWDGINLRLVESVVSAFARARANGKPVPRMHYVHLRGILGTRRTARKKPVAPPQPA